MRIRMYNVGFGDCFCIRDRKSSLLVDFGAANSKIEGRPRREVFDNVCKKLDKIFMCGKLTEQTVVNPTAFQKCHHLIVQMKPC